MLEIAVLKHWNSTTYKAAVQLMGSLTTYLDNISVSVSIPSSAMVVGNLVLVATPGGNIRDACIVSTWPQGSTPEQMAAALIEAHRTGATHALAQPPESHDNAKHSTAFAAQADFLAHKSRHGYLGADEIAILYLIGQRAISMIHKTWTDLNGFTEAHTGGSFTTSWWNGLLQTGTTINNIASIYSDFIYHQYNATGCITGLQIAPRQSTQQNFFIGWIYASTPDFTKRHYGLQIVNDQIFAVCGDGTNNQQSEVLITFTGLPLYAISIVYGAASIDFYINHVLKKSFTTLRPTGQSLRFLIWLKTTEGVNKTTYIRPLTIFPEHQY